MALREKTRIPGGQQELGHLFQTQDQTLSSQPQAVPLRRHTFPPLLAYLAQVEGFRGLAGKARE